VLLAQLKVHLEHIGHLLAREAVEGRKGMALQERLDLGSRVRRVLFGISRSRNRGSSIAREFANQVIRPMLSIFMRGTMLSLASWNN
jgi:hypothetical protein